MPRATLLLGLLCLALATLLLASIEYALFSQMREEGLVVAAGSLFLFAAMAAAAVVAGLLLRSAAVGATSRWLRPAAPGVRLALVALVPVNVLAMSFACGFPGCNPVCVTLAAGALGMGLLALRELRAQSPPLLLAVAPLYALPHCLCGNPINQPWIEAVGASPNCYAFSLLGLTFAALGLRGLVPGACLLLAAAPAGAAAAFAVGHHLLGFPW